MPELLQAFIDSPFREFAAMLLIAAVVGAFATFLRQPLIVAFIAVGIMVGPAWLGLATHGEELELLASIGIAVLLFLVGLRLDWQVILNLGPVALATGLGQVAFTSIIGFFLCLGLGLDVVTSIYISVALTFSSTIIIVKLLSDKREVDSLHGRIAVGFLIVQDIVVVLAMIVISAVGAGGGEGGTLEKGGTVVLKGLALLIAMAVLTRYVLPPAVRLMARHHELLLLFAVAWAVALAAVSDAIGFSRELGAFLAGVSLASTPFRDSLGARLTSIRDFLLLFFFINLGARLDIQNIRGDVVPAIVLSSFVLIGNPLIVMVIMGAMGYRKRTGFLAGLTVAQISEFSLILAALGVSLGHIPSEAMGLTTLVGFITIGLSTYMILYSHQLYDRIAPLLDVFERRNPFREQQAGDTGPRPADVILFGLGRYGSNLARRLSERNLQVLGVDFDPEVVRQWCRDGLCAQYGDAEDPEFAASLPLDAVQWVVATMPEAHVNRTLLAALRERGFRGRVALTAHGRREMEALQKAGADVVLRPFADAADRAADMIALELDRRNPQ